MSLHSSEKKIAIDSAPHRALTPGKGLSAGGALPVRRSMPSGEDSMGKSLKDKIAIVSGAANGIGRAMSLRLAEEGAWVLVTDIDNDGGESVVAEIQKQGGRANFHPVDIGAGDQIESAVQAVAEEFGRIDVLCNNAAYIGTWHDALNSTDEEWEGCL